jgi:ribonuclease BN (tRNA processing enzyme)
MKIKFLGRHNSESGQTKLVSFIINETLAVDAGSLASELSFQEQKKIGAILLSHAHYDHIRDIPAFVFNNLERKVQLYGLNEALELVSEHMFNGIIYPRFTDESSYVKQPVLELCALKLGNTHKIGDFTIIARPMRHTIETAGFEITSQDGKKVFYTGDTGPDLSYLWNDIKPDLLIIDLTFPNRLSNEAKSSGHLCPQLLKKELESFRQLKSYLPKVFPIHLYPQFETEIIREANKIACELGLKICTLNNDNELIL